jgi:hypothetical protein
VRGGGGGVVGGSLHQVGDHFVGVSGNRSSGGGVGMGVAIVVAIVVSMVVGISIGAGARAGAGCGGSDGRQQSPTGCFQIQPRSIIFGGV